MYYSIHWQRIQARHNIIRVRVTFLDERGQRHQIEKYYEEWIGVCTRHIQRVVRAIQFHFPGSRVCYEQVGEAKKILPYFEERLARGNLDYTSKPFYKVYTNASIKNVGRFFNRFKIGYYDPEDWLTRIYIDLCSRYQCFSFYYKWYDLKHDSEALLDSLVMIPDRREPDWTFAAFDLESVALEGNHVPVGHFPTDRIVMASLYKWNRRNGVRRYLLYLLPESIRKPLPSSSSSTAHEEDAFDSERDLLVRFHELLEGVDVITGYNINQFDLPCLFARLLWLKLYSILRHYRSERVGADVVVTYRDALTVDLYAYVKTFSGYDAPSLKLDDVARIKLQGDTKLGVKSTGIASWYRQRNLSRDLFEEEEDVERCFRQLRPATVSRAQDFGTFRNYLDYCLKDSELVYRIFEKETVLSFLVERANFTALNAVEALHLGNSRYLLELFRTYGTRLGYFVNSKFLKPDLAKNEQLLGRSRTYQGALNYCLPQKTYEDVSVLDFASMYPSALVSSNLCYGTCTVVSREAWFGIESRMPQESLRRLTLIPYLQHSTEDFERADAVPRAEKFAYPAFDRRRHPFVIVVLREPEAFLPQIVRHFLDARRFHQREFQKTGDVYHFNVQLGIKILVNSLYGVMANKDSPLAYLPIAVSIVTLARYQLLGSYHYLKNRGYEVCYADTDSLMVHRWPFDHCDPVNAFLGLPGVQLKFEQRMKRLLVLSKKRYVYEDASGQVVPKGFQRKVNGLVAFMTNYILERVWKVLFFSPPPPVAVETEEEAKWLAEIKATLGWTIWVRVLSEAHYRCRDPKRYSIYRKIKKLDQYVSNACAAVKYLRKYANRCSGDEHVEFTYSRADVAAAEAGNWVVDVEDCGRVDFEKLFVGQRKLFCTLLNLAFWKMDDPACMFDMVSNGLHWKRFVQAELAHRRARGRGVLLLVETSVKYTFKMNDHLSTRNRMSSQTKRYVASGYLAPGEREKRRRKADRLQFTIPEFIRILLDEP